MLIFQILKYSVSYTALCVHHFNFLLYLHPFGKAKLTPADVLMSLLQKSAAASTERTACGDETLKPITLGMGKSEADFLYLHYSVLVTLNSVSQLRAQFAQTRP